MMCPGRIPSGVHGRRAQNTWKGLEIACTPCLTRAEQETVILWDAQSRTAIVVTADTVTLRKL